jgi:hypothetical protein
MNKFDLTPDPRVLIALTHTAMKPLDALSELIDNAIDSFTIARNQGNDVSYPLVLLSLPSTSEVRRGEGRLEVRDNGPGMTGEMAEMALKAGFSSNNPYDSLGLFGMGLNIATGKMGSRTTLITARQQDKQAISVVVDLLEIQDRRNYEVVPTLIDKPRDFEHGTIIQVDNWWPEGNANAGFMARVIGNSRPEVRRSLGRRYATLIKDDRVRILLDSEECAPFEHCVWSDSRFVERAGLGKIYAVSRFNEVVGSQRRCVNCFTLVPDGIEPCPSCASASFRSLEERIKGWVGIQRYDNINHFGIDLIRNGRAIRVLEKSAFFEFTNDLGQTVKDYPIDSQYGRIIGEVHLDHVPVDFTKQDFQRSSAEWIGAVNFLRGKSSLQPRQERADENESIVYRLYQGFRRVRRFGRHDMYMGYWDDGKASRIGRDIEKKYLEEFTARKPGYFDDGEWWKLVEAADTPPLEKLAECTECGAENLQESDCCQVCDAILIGKPCVACREEIALSSPTCEHCGESQAPEIEEPWVCDICRTTNRSEDELCASCESVRGSKNPCSPDFLKNHSTKSEELSIAGCSIQLADGTSSQPIDVNCYIVLNNIVTQGGASLPAVVDKGETIDIFLNRQHPVFQMLSIKAESFIAAEIASYIQVTNGKLMGTSHKTAHTISNLMWMVINKYWSETLADTPEKLREDLVLFFSEVLNALPLLLREVSDDIFTELSDSKMQILVKNLLGEGKDISKMDLLKKSGEYLAFIDHRSLTNIFSSYPSYFFDGGIWRESFKNVPDIPDDIMDEVRTQTVRTYANCLEACCLFLETSKTDRTIVRRARSSLEYLEQNLED